jgi:hypothetical protein
LKSHLPILGSTLLLRISTPESNWRKPLLPVLNMPIMYIILTTMTLTLSSWSTIPNLSIPQVQSQNMMMHILNTIYPALDRILRMSRLLSDRAQVEISARLVGILRALHIGQWQSEPHQRHQNPCERRYQTLKRMTNTLLDHSGSPGYTWLLCLMYVSVLLNLTYNWTLCGIPLQCAEGSTQDISLLLRFYWWEPVYFKVDDAPFPSTSHEEHGHFVGISNNVGHAMTYKILCDKSLTVLYIDLIFVLLTTPPTQIYVWIHLMGRICLNPLESSNQCKTMLRMQVIK